MAPRFRIPVLLTLCSLLWVGPGSGAAETPPPAQEPEAAWLFPLGGQRGTALEVEIRGKALQSAYAVVAEEEGIRTQFRAVEEIVEESEEGPAEKADKKEPEYRVRVGVEIDAAARPGNHWFRVVTPRGVTNRVHFRVNADRVIPESADPHDQPDKAQAIDTPVVVNGQIDTPAEMDFYRVEATAGQELLFEVTPSQESVGQRLSRPDIDSWEAGKLVRSRSGGAPGFQRQGPGRAGHSGRGSQAENRDSNQPAPPVPGAGPLLCGGRLAGRAGEARFCLSTAGGAVGPSVAGHSRASGLERAKFRTETRRRPAQAVVVEGGQGLIGRPRNRDQETGPGR